MLRARLNRLLWTLALAATAAGAQPVPEYELKAAFLFNFALFTEWPPGAPEGMRLCVIGRDNFGEALDALRGKTVRGKPLEVRRLDTRREIGECHLLFIAENGEAAFQSALDEAARAAVLTVSDAPDAARRGAMIGLVGEPRRVAFEVNGSAAKRAGLALSSKLLRLAKAIH